MSSNNNINTIYESVNKAIRKSAQSKSMQIINKGKQYMINEITITNMQLAQKTNKHGFDFTTIPVPSLGDFSIRQSEEQEGPVFQLVFDSGYMSRIDDKLETLFANCTQNVVKRINNYHF